VVWFRREDVESTDPDPGSGEPLFLEKLSQMSDIVTLYVIMGKNTNIEFISREHWERYAGNLRVNFRGIVEFQNSLQKVVSHIEKDAAEGQKLAVGRRKILEQEFGNIHRRLSERYTHVYTGRQILKINPEDMNKRFADDDGEFRQALDKGFEDGIDEFSGRWNMRPLVQENLETFFNKSDATEWRESEARDFVLRVLMGQTIEKAQMLAGAVFDKTIAEVIAHLAEMCLLSVEDLLNRTQEFVDSKKEDGEDNEEAMIYGFTVRTNFIDMYVGFVVSVAIPVLKATVLPTIITGREQVSEARYRRAVKEAKQELSAEGVASPARPPTGCW